MNTSFDNSLEDNFNKAMKMTLNSHSHEELIAYLKSGEPLEKQLAALELSMIKNEKEADILVSNLVGQDGKIREAVAYKINELFTNELFTNFFVSQLNFSKFLDGILDINGNICRQIIEIIGINKEFDKYLSKKLPFVLKDVLEKIRNLTEEEKKYVISKRNFQLYWGLEALYSIAKIADYSEFEDIIFGCSEFEDYTIREKVAKILSTTDANFQPELKKRLATDENLYVRRYLL